MGRTVTATGRITEDADPMKMDPEDTSVETAVRPTPPDDLESRPATDFSLREISGLFTLGFEGSLVPVRMTPEALSQVIRRDSLDLAASRVFVREDRPVAFILMCTRGWTRRVSGMGVVAEYRRRGLGRRLMEAVIANCSDQGIHRILLEVVERNADAVQLYRDLGFRERRRLVGYTMPPSPPPDRADSLREMDPRALAKVVEYEAPPNPPWQLSAESTAAAGPPEAALRLEDKAYALVNGLHGEEGTLSLVLVPHAVRRQGWGLRMIDALRSRYPGRGWRIPTRLPDNLAPEFFERAGFRRSELSQIEMELDLSES